MWTGSLVENWQNQEKPLKKYKKRSCKKFFSTTFSNYTVGDNVVVVIIVVLFWYVMWDKANEQLWDVLMWSSLVSLRSAILDMGKRKTRCKTEDVKWLHCSLKLEMEYQCELTMYFMFKIYIYVYIYTFTYFLPLSINKGL